MIRKLMPAVGLTAVGCFKLIVLCLCVVLAGCATSRSEIKLQSPAVIAPTTTATTAQRVVVIGKITDERVFEDAPSDPSTPSLGFGGAGKATDDVKGRAIARKRNTYGKALGDVVLQQGQTVEGVIRENLTAAFQQAGYQVKDAANAGPSALVVDVQIKKFWAWFDPGFWAITLSDNVATDLIINGVGAPVVVSTHVEEKRQAATDDAWMNIVAKGLDAYRAEVSHQMQGLDATHLSVATANVPATAPSVQPAAVPAAASPVAHGPSPATEAPNIPASPTPASAPVASVGNGAASDSSTSQAVPAAADPASPSASAASTSAVDAGTLALAQSAASEVGCGAVQANGGSTFVAPCGSYSVLIDCYNGQCRPMHTVDVKKDE